MYARSATASDVAPACPELASDQLGIGLSETAITAALLLGDESADDRDRLGAAGGMRAEPLGGFATPAACDGDTHYPEAYPHLQPAGC